ncbi:MAG: hypothetical protein ABL904_00640 [Hyphomicrobiaceae bacterium]
MKLLRSEIELQIKQINENERNCIIGVGLLIYFTASLEPPRNEVVTHIIRALPLAVALLGTLRAAGLRSSIDVMDGYLLRVEEAIDSKGEFWVKAYSKSLNGRSKLLRYWPRKLYWAALIVFGLIYYWIGSEVIGTAKSK